MTQQPHAQNEVFEVDADSSCRRGLYPSIEPYMSGRLPVTGGHELYYYQCGNPDGKPVVFLHGGPGGSSKPVFRRYFDPEAYRIIHFDQRGCGKSTPHAGLENNTTWHLVDDIEALRQHLGIDVWMVFGGSWGSALALAYAQLHPSRVTEMVLYGIFTLRQKELQWFYQDGASRLFPDAWEEYAAPIPHQERDDIIAAYYKRLTSDDTDVQLEAARAWSIWEARTLSLLPNPEREVLFGDDAFALAFARIECHYFYHGGFFSYDDQLIAEIGKCRHIPTVIVQGRYDVVTPMRTAWDLHCAWPEAEFRLVADAGHTATDPGNKHEIIVATDQFRHSLTNLIA